MVFKLVRTDTEEPCKIQLPLGVHLIGRGKFLDCDDKRVSRKHGELEVTDDSISIKALHQNPCFYIKKGTEETQILRQDCTVTLSNGDKFGLLPESCWYELLHCVDIADEEDCTQRIEELQPEGNDITIAAIEKTNSIENTSVDEELLNVELNEVIGPPQSPESPSLIQRTEGGVPDESLGRQENKSPTTEDSPRIPSTSSTINYQPNELAIKQEDGSPSKRRHSPQPEADVKRVKQEPSTEDVKQEPGSPDVQPGPSTDQGNAAGPNNPAGPASPVKPAAPARERCMYGANCYRKNPLHKAQFSHPADPDWAASGACPYGGACRRRDPRHWSSHSHPPGAVPRPATGNRTKAKRASPKKRGSMSDDCDEDSPQTALIVTGKRARKTVERTSWSASEDEDGEDPYQTDDEDEWTPGDTDSHTQTQTQDFD